MTQRKKIVIIFGSIVSLIAILFTVFWFVPMLRWKVFGVPVKTDQFLPQPDVIRGYYADQEATFSKDQQEKIYHAFMEIMPALKKCETKYWGIARQDVQSRFMCLEFCYDQAYRYTAPLGELSELFELTAFDMILLIMEQNSITVMKLLDGECVGERDCVTLEFEGSYTSFQVLVKNAMSDVILNPMGVARGSVDLNSIQTTNLFHAPNAMVLSYNGRSIVLSDEQNERIYSAFAKMDELQEGYPRFGPYGQRTEYIPAEVYEDMKGNPCLEFRYDQRYSFNGVFSQWYEETGAEVTPISFEFDSIVLILCETYAKIIVCRDGLYESVSATRNYDFGDGYPAFRDEVLALMP